jgi:putative ubiquitin-RnfH superfamily antitoxin RatB of RatAB toxin-antitoxin module
MDNSRTIRVEVVYALPSRQRVERVTAPIGSTAREVIESSELLSQFPEIDLARNRIGIYSRLIELNAVVQEGDRIEIYRPLQADPKSVRRQLAREGKTMGGGKSE